MNLITWKLNDRLPAQDFLLTLADGKTPIDLTGASGVALRVRAAGTPGTLGAVVNLTGTATIVTATAGRVRYTPGVADGWGTTLGDFYWEVLVSWPGGPQTVPNNGYGLLRVVASLA